MSSSIQASRWRGARVLLGGGLLSLGLFLLTLALGPAELPLQEILAVFSGGGSEVARTVLLELRLPRALTALLVGVALGLSGLQMQAVFRNALADPWILGVSSGASLGVAVAVLAGGGAGTLFGIPGLFGTLGVVGAATLGAMLVVAVMLRMAYRVRDAVVLLVLGVVLSAVLGAVVTTLVYLADRERTRAFVEWGFGSFARTTLEDTLLLAMVVVIGLVLAVIAIRSLDALLLGESYAETLGVDTKRARLLILSSASLLAAGAVAFAGPIGFLGIAIPHTARAVTASQRHRALVPATLVLGAAFGLACGLLAEAPASGVALPVQAAAALVGGPVVFWVLLRLRSELMP